MPQVRKMTPEEVHELTNKGKGQRKLTEEQYDAILSDYAYGDYGEATLDVGENRLTVRNRLKAAAKRRGADIDFRRTSGDLIRFRVLQHGNGTNERNEQGTAPVAIAEPEPVVVAPETPPAPAKRKGGRPRKNP